MSTQKLRNDLARVLCVRYRNEPIGSYRESLEIAYETVFADESDHAALMSTELQLHVRSR